ncbi:TonB-dependent receptor [Aquisalimonas asiatica]|uniref:Iron complex outermembrane recepter protein n=1 Tax=Aquisalimonas asiatica TaxID=406100 RepID=A0A1H8TD37_9GAMM|nr:TonB-dependent siderophore receptor [Aquisalimonas asiatica]SEO89059.1 iron complex outermembrane recepter protein [Aquisalimonas asiatica]
MILTQEVAAERDRTRTVLPASLLAVVPLLPGAVAVVASPVLHAEAHVHLAPIEVLSAPSGLRLDSQSDIGSRLGLSVDETPGQVDVIDQTRMQERGDRTTTEAVTGAVGFSDANTLGNLSGLNARGFSEVAILYDGISVGRPNMTSRPQGTWIYDRIETISGPASVLHGEGSIVGAVNFVPRRPNPEVTETDILMSAGSFNSSRVAAGRGGPTNVDGLSFRIDGERQTSDGYMDNADMHRDTISAGLRYDASDRLVLEGNLVYINDSLPPYSGVPVDPEKGEPSSDLRRRNPNARDAYIEGEEFRLTLDANYFASDSVQLRNRFQAYEGERDWLNVEGFEITEDDELKQTFALEVFHDQTFLANRSDALIDHHLFGRDARTVVGLQLIRERFENGSDGVGLDRVVDDPRNPADTGSVRDLGLDARAEGGRTDRNQVALFAENRLLLGGGLSLVSGVRGDWIKFEVNRDGSEKDTFTTEEGRLGFVWEATPTLSLFGQATTGSQFTFSTNSPSADSLDTDLQRSTGFEGGVRGRAVDGTWQWQVTAFDIEKRNRFASDPVPDDPQRQRQVGRRVSQGVEVSGYWEPVERLALEANASVLSAEFRDDDDLGGNTPAGVPEQLGNLWATWTVTQRATARAHVRYVGEQQANNDNTLQIPSYTLLNLSSSYALDDNWEVTARARNVTDERYYTQAWFGDQYFVGGGRSFELELSASF